MEPSNETLSRPATLPPVESTPRICSGQSEVLVVVTHPNNWKVSAQGLQANGFLILEQITVFQKGDTLFVSAHLRTFDASKARATLRTSLSLNDSGIPQELPFQSLSELWRTAQLMEQELAFGFGLKFESKSPCSPQIKIAPHKPSEGYPMRKTYSWMGQLDGFTGKGGVHATAGRRDNA